MQLTPEMIEEYFTRYEWSYTRSSENTWITGVRTSVSSFRIFIRLSEHWVYFVINPFVVAPPNPVDRLRFYYHVLRLNLDMNMAKFGLDSDGDLFLAVELPTENFVYSHFADALNGLSHHAERLYSEVFNLAHNPGMVEGPYDEELNTEDLPTPESTTERPLDDLGLPEDIINDSGEIGPIIAGKEVRIVDDLDGNARIEFETAGDLEEADEPPPGNITAGNHSLAEGSGPSQQDSDEPDKPNADRKPDLDSNGDDED